MTHRNQVYPFQITGGRQEIAGQLREEYKERGKPLRLMRNSPPSGRSDHQFETSITKGGKNQQPGGGSGEPKNDERGGRAEIPTLNSFLGRFPTGR